MRLEHFSLNRLQGQHPNPVMSPELAGGLAEVPEELNLMDRSEQEDASPEEFIFFT